MLKTMRKNLKSLAPTLWFVIIAFIISIFAVWGGAGRLGEGPDSNTIATVGGEKISADIYMATLQQRVEMLRREFKEVDQNFIQQLNIPQQVLEQLIQQTLLEQTAEEMGIKASDEEVREKIMSYPVFQKDGRFIGFDQYQQILSWNRMTAGEFEKNLRSEIIIEKAVKVLTAGVTVSQEELWENYKKTNESVKLEYLVVPEAEIELDTEPGADELKQYYADHRDSYEIPERRSADYYFLKTEDLKAEIEVKDSEMDDYYEKNLSQFMEPEKIRVSRIYLPYEDKDQALVRSEIDAIRERIQVGESFGQLAKTLSKDEKADQEGDWGLYEWKRLDPEEQTVVESLSLDEMSNPVETAEGISLLKVTEKEPAVQKTLEEVKERIMTILSDQKAQELADRRIAQLEKAARKEKNLDVAAQKLGLAIIPSGPLKEGEAIEDIDPSGSLSRALFSLQEKEISTPIYTYQGIGLAQLQAVEPARPATYEEAESDIREDLNSERRKALALEKARSLQTAARSQSLEELGEQDGVDFQSSDAHIREQYLTVIGENSEVDEFAFTSEINAVSEPIRYDQGYALVKLLDRKNVNREEFEEKKETERETYLDSKRNQLFQSFYTKLREEKNVKPNYGLFLKINSDVLSWFSR